MGKWAETEAAYFGGSDLQEAKETMNGRVLPILFNTDMVQAILDGRKTVTRRVIMPHNRKKANEQAYCQGNGLWIDSSIDNPDKKGHIKDYSVSPCWMSYDWYIERYALYQTGDILYVRETWCKNADSEEYYYAANRKAGECAPYGLKWHPSIHMPKEAARIWLKVTDVRVERLQDMSGQDILREGVNCHVHPEAHYFDGNQKMMFAELWDSTIKKTDMDRYGWDANPWVWEIEFERCKKPVEG